MTDYEFALTQKIMRAFDSHNPNAAFGIAKETVEKNRELLTDEQYVNLYEFSNWMYDRASSRSIVWSNDNTGKPEWIIRRAER